MVREARAHHIAPLFPKLQPREREHKSGPLFPFKSATLWLKEHTHGLFSPVSLILLQRGHDGGIQLLRVTLGPFLQGTEAPSDTKGVPAGRVPSGHCGLSPHDHVQWTAALPVPAATLALRQGSIHGRASHLQSSPGSPGESSVKSQETTLPLSPRHGPPLGPDHLPPEAPLTLRLRQPVKGGHRAGPQPTPCITCPPKPLQV